MLMLRFLGAGLLNTAFGYAVYALLALAGLGYTAALIGATVAGVAWNYQTSRRLVFKVPGRAPGFVALYAATLALNWLALRTLIHLGASELAGQAILVLPMAALAFAGQRLLVFNAPMPEPSPVVPPPQHAAKPRHWLIKDGWLVSRWLALTWDQAAGVWRDGVRTITPERAARKRWRYSGPLQSPADIAREPPRDAWQVHG